MCKETDEEPNSATTETKPEPAKITKEPNPVEEPKEKPLVIKSGDFDEQDIKVVSLGAGESGKSTLWRQMKLLFGGGLDDIREVMKPSIRVNVICDMQMLANAFSKSGGVVSAEISQGIEMVKGLAMSEEELNPEVASVIAKLWADPVMKAIYERENSIGLGDNSNYFFDKVERIASPDYVPTDEDVLKSRIMTTGMARLDLLINEKKARFIDVGGQKCERPRWAKCLQGVNFVIYVVSLSDFDQMAFEDGSVSRTSDSLTLFEKVCQSQALSKKPIFLLLNKYDAFQRKLSEKPNEFRQAFPEFQGDAANVDECVEHVKNTYLSKLGGDRDPNAWVETLVTCAMDSTKVKEVLRHISEKVIE